MDNLSKAVCNSNDRSWKFKLENREAFREVSEYTLLNWVHKFGAFALSEDGRRVSENSPRLKKEDFIFLENVCKFRNKSVYKYH